MSLITPTLDNRHQIRQSIRRRQIVDSNERISSGNRLTNSQSVDSGALRISKRLEVENKISHSAKKNLENAYHLAQYQSDILSYADNTMNRMNELAYEATDMIHSQSDRENLNTEFQSLSGQLTDLLYDRTYDKVMFDPLSSTNIETIDLPPPVAGSSSRVSEKIDIGALSSKVKLWWDPLTARDRFQIYVGGKRIFDTGEYRSNVGGRRSEVVNGETRTGDYFEVDFGPGQISVTEANDNRGNGDFLDYYDNVPTSDYPFTDTPNGDSSIVEFVINDEGPEGIAKSSGTVWYRWLEIEKQAIEGPKGVKNEKGDLLQIEPVGFSTLSGLSLLTREDASNALTKTREETDSIQTQIFTLSKTFSEIKFETERVESKSQSRKVSLGRIQDTDMASEYTNLAKNLLIQQTSDHAMIHSRISAENVFNLLM
jgi:flagellin-like hook-associated protein FlgL